MLARQAKKTTENTAREAADRYFGRQDDGFITIPAGACSVFLFACKLFRGMASCDEEIRCLEVQILVQGGSRIVGKDVSSSTQPLKAKTGK